MAYFSLVVKGNRFQAAKAASDRGIAFAFKREVKYGDTVGSSPASQRDKIRLWMDEEVQVNTPLPIGTLLTYKEHNE